MPLHLAIQNNPISQATTAKLLQTNLPNLQYIFHPHSRTSTLSPIQSPKKNESAQLFKKIQFRGVYYSF
jgi:hypothetical protein